MQRVAKADQAKVSACLPALSILSVISRFCLYCAAIKSYASSRYSTFQSKHAPEVLSCLWIMRLESISIITGVYQQDTSKPSPRRLPDETAGPIMRARSRRLTFRRPGEMIYKLTENPRNIYKMRVMEDVPGDYQVK